MKKNSDSANVHSTEDKSIFRQAGEVIGSIGAQISIAKDNVVDFVQHEVVAAKKTARKIGKKVSKATKGSTVKKAAKKVVKKVKKATNTTPIKKAVKKAVKKTGQRKPVKNAIKKTATGKRK